MNIQDTSPLQIYIGYDPREYRAYDVCKYSLERNLYVNSLIHQPYQININKLYSKDIVEYNRDFGEPQSTDFTFTRFWVPYLSKYKGYSLFVDCDFIFIKPAQFIISELEKPLDKAIYVVQHPSYIPKTETKMDNIRQNSYYRKNWASLILFNNEHPALKTLNPAYLNNHKPGLDFHQFRWLDDKDIGHLSIKWNILDDYYYLNVDEIGAIHYTDGGPWFDNYKNTVYSNIWVQMENWMKNDKKT